MRQGFGGSFLREVFVSVCPFGASVFGVPCFYARITRAMIPRSAMTYIGTRSLCGVLLFFSVGASPPRCVLCSTYTPTLSRSPSPCRCVSSSCCPRRPPNDAIPPSTPHLRRRTLRDKRLEAQETRRRADPQPKPGRLVAARQAVGSSVLLRSSKQRRQHKQVLNTSSGIRLKIRWLPDQSTMFGCGSGFGGLWRTDPSDAGYALDG